MDEETGWEGLIERWTAHICSLKARDAGGKHELEAREVGGFWNMPW